MKLTVEMETEPTIKCLCDLHGNWHGIQPDVYNCCTYFKCGESVFNHESMSFKVMTPTCRGCLGILLEEQVEEQRKKQVPSSKYPGIQVAMDEVVWFSASAILNGNIRWHDVYSTFAEDYKGWLRTQKVSEFTGQGIWLKDGGVAFLKKDAPTVIKWLESVGVMKKEEK